ncbi:TPA: glucosyltransferase domain-containing protein [Vibrio cholerae]
MNFKEIIANDFEKNKCWYFTLFIAPLIFFFYEFSNMSFTQDELRRHSSYIVDPQWLSQGRFGMYFLTWLYSNNPVFPYVGTFLSLVVTSIFVRLFFELVCYELNYKILVLLLFVSCPFSYYIYSFTTVSFAIGIIYLLSFFSVYFIFVKEKNLLVSIILLSLSISIYQSAITVYLLMFIISILFRYEVNRNFEYVVSKIGICVLSVFLSLVFYFVFHKIITQFISGNEHGYINSFVDFNFNLQYISSLFINFTDRVIKFLSGSDTVLPQKNPFQFISFVLVFLISIFQIKSRGLLTTFLIVLIFFIPFMLELISKNPLPARSYIAIPLLCTFVFYWLLTRVNNIVFSNLILLAFVMNLIINLINLTKFSFYENNSWDRDKRFASEIVNQILNLDGIEHVINSNNGKIPLHSVGFYQERNDMAFNKTFENIGRGFFAWGDNELQNSSNLFNSLGWSEFSFAYPVDVAPYVNEIRSLPRWPEPGSIKIVGDFVVIKLSDYSENQILTVCNYSNSESCLVSYNPQSIKFDIRFDDTIVQGRSILYELNFGNIGLIRNSQINISNDEYLISSHIGDSYILFPELKVDRDVIIFLDVEYTSEQTLTFYFKDSKYGHYSESNVLRFHPFNGRKRIYVKVPAWLVKNELRIDFLDSQEIFKLHKLSIYY